MKPAPPAVALARSDLHESLSDPALDAISFLNEVMDRFPRAVSFAPGAPFAGLLDGLDVADCLRRYQDYLAGERNMTPAQITKHLYQYGPSRGQINDLLAEALALDEGIAVTGGDIVVTVGCQEALLLVLRALCAGPGDLLAVVNPCFAGIAGAARLLDMPIHAVAETAQGVDLLQLEGICQAARERGQRVRALYVAPDFSNPSGTVLSLDARTRLLALAQQEDFLILEDNAYGFTAAEGSRLPTLKALDRAARVVYFGTCAKTCMPGVRVGFVVADQAVVDSAGKRGRLADELATLKSMVTVNTSPICQAIVGGMLLAHGRSITAMARDKAALYRSNLAHLLQALERQLQGLPGVSWNRPEGGFFVCLRLPVAVDAALLEYCAGEYGVLWTPMRFFSLDAGDNYELRLSCSYLTPEQIDDGVRRLGRFLRDPRACAVAEAA